MFRHVQTCHADILCATRKDEGTTAHFFFLPASRLRLCRRRFWRSSWRRRLTFIVVAFCGCLFAAAYCDFAFSASSAPLRPPVGLPFRLLSGCPLGFHFCGDLLLPFGRLLVPLAAGALCIPAAFRLPVFFGCPLRLHHTLVCVNSGGATDDSSLVETSKLHAFRNAILPT